MWIISQLICLGSLAGLTVSDIRYRKVPGEILIMGAIGAFVYQLFFRRENLWVLGGGIGIGLIFLLISKVTREGLGYGDSLAILILGAYLGIWELLQVLAGAFGILTVGAIIVLSRKKMARKCTLPFFPFLTVGYALYLMTEL